MGDKNKKYGPEEKRAFREKNYHQNRNDNLSKGSYKDVRRSDKGK